MIKWFCDGCGLEEKESKLYFYPTFPRYRIVRSKGGLGNATILQNTFFDSDKETHLCHECAVKIADSLSVDEGEN